MSQPGRFVFTASLILFCCFIAAEYCMAESRTALVIGNGDYEKSKLANTTNDAEDMAQSLQEMGFDVTKLENADLRKMEDALDNFYRRIKDKGGTGLFYYAGHGVQVKGQNYLIPVNANIESESDVQYKALDASRVLGKMEDAKNEVNIVILDACRDNPFARSFRSEIKGLSRMDAPAGSLISYATAPGSIASDGEARNGIFTGYLIRHMRTPGSSIEQVLKQTRRDVMAATNNQQVPWESSSLTGDFFFLTTGPDVQSQPSTENAPTVLSIEANIAEAKVHIDGQPVGVTPLKGFSVSPGPHRVQVIKDGFNAYDKELIVTAGREHRMDVLLEPSVGQTVNRNQGDWRDPGMDMNFTWVSGGCMDDESAPAGIGDKKAEEPRRKNCVGSFWFGKTEITVGQWRRFIKETGYQTEAETSGGAWIRTETEWVKQDGTFWANPGFLQTDDQPVTCISLADVTSFISWLNGKGNGVFRLPTEMEWEYACCHAGTPDGRKWQVDPVDTCQYANMADISLKKNSQTTATALCDDGNPETAKVGTLKPNPLGIHDMLGNVWEWCGVSFENRSASDGEAPHPTTVPGSIIRGGSWNASPTFIRCESRIRVDPSTRTNSLGFRLLKEAR